MDRDDILAANRAFEARCVAGDFAGLAALYTENARLMPPGAPMQRGRAAIAGFWPQVASALGVTAVKLVTEELTITGDTAQEIGRAAISAKGAPEPVSCKYVVLWKKEAGAWKLDADIWNMNE